MHSEWEQIFSEFDSQQLRAIGVMEPAFTMTDVVGNEQKTAVETVIESDMITVRVIDEVNTDVDCYVYPYSSVETLSSANYELLESIVSEEEWVELPNWVDVDVHKNADGTLTATPRSK